MNTEQKQDLLRQYQEVFKTQIAEYEQNKVVLQKQTADIEENKKCLKSMAEELKIANAEPERLKGILADIKIKIDKEEIKLKDVKQTIKSETDVLTKHKKDFEAVKKEIESSMKLEKELLSNKNKALEETESAWTIRNAELNKKELDFSAKMNAFISQKNILEEKFEKNEMFHKEVELLKEEYTQKLNECRQKEDTFAQREKELDFIKSSVLAHEKNIKELENNLNDKELDLKVKQWELDKLAEKVNNLIIIHKLKV